MEKICQGSLPSEVKGCNVTDTAISEWMWQRLKVSHHHTEKVLGALAWTADKPVPALVRTSLSGVEQRRGSPGLGVTFDWRFELNWTGEPWPKISIALPAGPLLSRLH